ncbi:hypothetical protein S40288_08473 [Stachybotrys chartarum IBT 40288]|nr:hypothetical protein S40288_08473 [Stachybotrys chartarum IBT 40288]
MSQLALRRSQASSDAGQHDNRPSNRRSILIPLAGTPLTSSSSVPRSPRPPISSPLSASSGFTYSTSTSSPYQSTFPDDLRRQPISFSRPFEHGCRSAPVEHTTFFDSSSSSLGSDFEAEQAQRFDLSRDPNDPRSEHQYLNSRPQHGSIDPHGPAMAGSKAAAKGSSGHELPRNSSIDSAISALSSKSHQPSGSVDANVDVAALIKTAGSPEALIRHLLKEKQSQSQQNSQLWRLVDKQRAMILGLNKDLERAFKDKEKYRSKLKEVMADPAISKAAGADSSARDFRPQVSRPDNGRVSEVNVVVPPDSPVVDSDSQKQSPTLDVAMAPYPITPPADHPHPPLSAVEELLNPNHAMPKPQEHAYDKFDHEADDRAADLERQELAQQQLKDIPFNLSLPPSRAIPSAPPSMPPPKPPTALPPSLAVVEATPQTDEGLPKFPSPSPRKAPPAPLQLKPESISASQVDDESDSDYDALLEVDKVLDEKRGRRRTREEDDRERTILAVKEAEARSASKKSKSSKPPSPSEIAHPKLPSSDYEGAGPASLAAVLSGEDAIDLTVPLRSPGLPSTPRPFGVVPKSPMNGPLSPRISSLAGPPLSPRPPRQPIPLPPHTPLVSSHQAPSIEGPSAPSTREAGIVTSPTSPSAVGDPREAGQSNRGARSTGRSEIYQGLVTEEYPDLLLPPNALPSIQIRVASSRMKPSRASLLSLTQLEEDPVFTLAIISRADGGELWRIEKDSASLSKLDHRLKQCPTFTAKTPDKSLFNGHAPAKLDARRIALNHYMEEVVNTPLDTATAIELCRYLSSHALPPNLDEMGSTGTGSPEGNGPSTGPDGRPFRSGYLTKRGKNFGGWKARFFVLEGPHLKYYECPGGAHLGTIKLQNAQIGKQAQSVGGQSPAPNTAGDDFDNHYRHAFLILEPKKKDSSTHIKHVLCAESDKERDRWVDALLRWIDYRDPDDPDSPTQKAAPSERQKPAAPETPGNKPKKSAPGRAHQTSDSDTLIGVKYDSTLAGEAPHSNPTRPKTSGGHPEQASTHALAAETMSSHAHKMISGPKDAHAIADAAAWGNKQGLGVPSTEEKKLRKRSFFGFGPKTRSSSDGQDSLFGGSEGATPPQGHYHGPVRQVFGASLGEAVRYNSPVDVRVPLPSVVYRCIQYLDAKNAILEEGIFRLSGSNVVVKQLRERFNTEGDINLLTDDQFYDIHAVASLLKLYLRELPTTILTRDLHLEFLSTTELTNRVEKLAALQGLVQRLPLANATLLKYLLAFLIKIINNADMNKMTVRNVGIVFSPTLNIPAPVFAIFLQNYEAVFGMEPEEYELPSPSSEAEEHGRADAPPRFEPPRRPSTSSGSASPQRSTRDNQRLTPTPPLLMTVNGARSSPTPPLAVRQTYEPAYVTQPRPGSSRHEPSYAVHDGHGMHASSRGAPGYDRQTYQPSPEEGNGNLAAYDQPNRRRESAIFMGGLVGLQHQGSRSRLREETRF